MTHDVSGGIPESTGLSPFLERRPREKYRRRYSAKAAASQAADDGDCRHDIRRVAYRLGGISATSRENFHGIG